MIRTEGLTKTFPATRRHDPAIVAVENLDLEVREGEVFGLLGPNGAGKTTTVRMLACLIAPTAGRAWVDGLPVGAESTAIRRRIGILTESPGLYDKLSAERNLAFFARLYEVPAPQRDAQVRRYLELLDLWDRRHELVGGFSKGMKQKMAIARALIHEPRVLFLDEPTAALDPEMARVVRDFIAELRRAGRTIVLCTHNLDEAERLCDRIAVLNTRLIAVDTPANLRARLFGRRVAVRLRRPDADVVEMLRALPFVRAVEAADSRLTVDLEDPEEQTPALVRALAASTAEVLAVGEVEHSLEDVYFRLVNGRDRRVSTSDRGAND